MEDCAADFISRVYIWQGRTLYLGPLPDHPLHRQLSTSLCIGLEKPVAIETERGIQNSPIHLVRTGQKHRLITNKSCVAILFFDPHALLARKIKEIHLKSIYQEFLGGIQELLKTESDQIFPLLNNIPVKSQMDQIEGRASSTDELYSDPRIATIVRTVVTEPGRYSREELANMVGISGSRLSHIFTDQVGVSLRFLSSWFRLKLAAIYLSQGASMVESALEAGFYDQSHFSNEFKRMFGLSPGSLFRSAANIQWWIQAEKSTPSVLSGK